MWPIAQLRQCVTKHHQTAYSSFSSQQLFTYIRNYVHFMKPGSSEPHSVNVMYDTYTCKNGQNYGT